MYKEKLTHEDKLNAIAYSRVCNTGYDLTTLEIILVHQNMQKGSKLSKNIQDKLEKLELIIKVENWTRPITRLTSELKTQTLNTTTGNWQILKK